MVIHILSKTILGDRLTIYFLVQLTFRNFRVGRCCKWTIWKIWTYTSIRKDKSCQCRWYYLLLLIAQCFVGGRFCLTFILKNMSSPRICRKRTKNIKTVYTSKLHLAKCLYCKCFSIHTRVRNQRRHWEIIF